MKTKVAPPRRVCHRLQQARLARGLLIREVVAQVGISRNAYTNLEQGYTSPSFDTIIAIAQCLGVSLDYLAGFTDDPTPPQHRTGAHNAQGQ